MPWSFRRSISRGPFRLNLSRRGLGASIGVRGLRVGTGPRGTYVRAGRGGFVYQQYLRPGRAPVPVIPSPRTAPFIAPEGATKTEFLAAPSSDGDAAIAEINQERNSVRWSGPMLGLTVIGLVSIAMLNAAAGWYVPLLVLFVVGVMLRRREAAARAIVLHYDLDPGAQARYAMLCGAFRDGGACARVWRILSERTHGDHKHNAGANTAIQRTPTWLGFGGGGLLTVNLDAPVLAMETARIVFLPDKMLTITPTAVGSVTYDALSAKDVTIRFVETDTVPPDATRVGTTWSYVNQDGGPDRRFRNNRQFPVLLYSELTLMHPAFSLTLQFSRQDVARRVAEDLRRFIAYTGWAQGAARSEAPPTLSSPAALSVPEATAAPVPFSASLDSTVSVVNALLERMNTTVPPLRTALDAAQSAPLALVSPMSVADSLTWFRSELAALQALMPCVLSLCTDSLRAALVAAPEKAVPATAQEVWVASCRTVFSQLTSWEDGVRSRTVAPMFQEAQRLMRGLTTEFADAIGRLPAQLHPSSPTAHDFGVNTNLRLERLAPLDAELARITSELLKSR